MQENYLAKWLNNELTEAELETFKKSDAYASYQKIAAVSATLEAPEFDIDKALTDSKNKRTTPKGKVLKLNPFKKLMRVAAVAALFITTAYFFINSDEHIKTDLAQTEIVILPDASEVVLNAESEIEYNKKNWSKKRLLELNGEAYFKVAKGKKFTVQTSSGIVQVLGTQFNVANRPNYFEVTCFEGLVSVTYKNNTLKLPAGTSFLVLNDEIVSTEAPKTDQPSWITNESAFTSIPLNFVLAELERQYNVTIETKTINTNTLFTGTFTNKNINSALKSICVPNNILYTVEGNKVILHAKNAE
ncbi:FecR family protein [Cellulophaga sp. Z1A5H]|uniref:FecR family protein n=1 Tax=Cellulophaga sp. Z1A5H TaxID=2687291 RepID=UPI0013FD8567|nr:FecR family protein [Cellulophaga sp. Z1A5H]